jgi:protoporphyrinogen oxidase
MKKPVVVIVGAGPAGLTAAYELANGGDFQPVVYEADNTVGGISKTVVHHGNRMDLGGHRFFSKSQRVLDWWKKILPFQSQVQSEEEYDSSASIASDHPFETCSKENVGRMLRRIRRSSILFEGKLFDYPISFHPRFFFQLGLFRMIRIGLSYIWVRVMPERQILTLEDLFIHRFGKTLYTLFFRDFTEKVWGRSCKQISAEWGHQRIKNLSVAKTVSHAVRQSFSGNRDLDPSLMETSLINQFFYPAYGPGQLWDEAARKVVECGGQIHLEHRVVGFTLFGSRIHTVHVEKRSGERSSIEPDWVISTMPIPELIAGMDGDVPTDVKDIASRLEFRGLIVVGLLLRRFALIQSRTKHDPPDQWIYIQDRRLRIGRIQIFNHWSPCLVQDPNTIWVGLEYFSSPGEDFWNRTDEAIRQFAVEELVSAGFIDRGDVLDALVVRVPLAYPAYWGGYDHFDQVRAFVDSIDNLFLAGRNGMHRYNNQDHSMLTAMTAVENIKAGLTDKSNIWEINTEKKPHDYR